MTTETTVQISSVQPMATAFCQHGWVTVSNFRGEISVFNYGTHKDFSDIGSWENRDVFAAVAAAAKAQLESMIAK